MGIKNRMKTHLPNLSTKSLIRGKIDEHSLNDTKILSIYQAEKLISREYSPDS